MAEHEAPVKGLQDPAVRRKVYTAAVVVGGLVVAVAITLGVITAQQVTDFIAQLGWAVAAVAGVAGVLQGALARKNTTPPGE